MKRLIAAVSIALLAVSAGPAVAKDWTTIRFGTDASYAPFESKAPDGKLVGFDIDLGNEICARLKAKCVWLENDFDGMIPALKAKKFDAVLSSMSITPQRAQQIGFTTKIYNQPTRLVVKKAAAAADGRIAEGQIDRRGTGHDAGNVCEGVLGQARRERRVVPEPGRRVRRPDLGRLDAALQDEVQAAIGFLKSPRGANYTFVGPERRREGARHRRRHRAAQGGYRPEGEDRRRHPRDGQGRHLQAARVEVLRLRHLRRLKRRRARTGATPVARVRPPSSPPDGTGATPFAVASNASPVAHIARRFAFHSDCRLIVRGDDASRERISCVFSQ